MLANENGQQIKSLTPLGRWQQLATSVLGVLLDPEHTQDKLEFLFGEGFTEVDFPPGHYRNAVRWLKEQILQNAENKGQFSIEALSSAIGVDANAMWQLTAQTEPYDVMHFESNLKELRPWGQLTRKQQLLSRAARKMTVDNHRELGAEVQSRLLLIDSTQTKIEGNTADSLSDTLSAEMELEEVECLPFGVKALDKVLMGGIRPRELMALAGPAKSGKTRAAYNLALEAVRRGKNVTICQFELGFRETAFMLHAMLGAEYLVENDFLNSPEYDGTVAGELSPILLQTAGKTHKKWDQRLKSLSFARGNLKQYGKRLRVYTPERQYGGLHDLASLDRVLLLDKIKYGEADLVIIDHTMAIQVEGDGPANRMSSIAQHVQNLTRNMEKAAVVLLAQQNLDRLGKKSGHNPGMYGGVALTAAMDTILVCHGSLDPDTDTENPDRCFITPFSGRYMQRNADTVYAWWHRHSGRFVEHRASYGSQKTVNLNDL